MKNISSQWFFVRLTAYMVLARAPAPCDFLRIV
jgi:hypothetical protein